MKQITIQTAKATIIVFDLPEDALNFRGIESISGAEFKILGKATELTGNMYGNIVEPSKFYTNMWMNYEKPDSSHRSDQCRTVTESFSSLLSANGVMLENPCGEEPDPIIIDQFPEQVCCGFPTPNGSCCGSGVIQWKQEQIENPDWIKWRNEDEKVWSNPYVLIETN